MSAVPRCTVCDDRIDAYGRDGTRCARCNEPCPTCGKDTAFCPHPLPALKTERFVWESSADGKRGRIAA